MCMHVEYTEKQAWETLLQVKTVIEDDDNELIVACLVQYRLCKI